MAGNIFRANHGDSSAASVNIEVIDNDQSVERDQVSGELVITRYSEVVIRDAEAAFGYDLSAKLVERDDPILGIVVSIYPRDLSHNTSLNLVSPCSEASPCILSTASPTTILQTDTGNTAIDTIVGETTEWVVTITIPAATNPGNYITDIEYSEEAYTPPDLGAMQALTNENCPTRVAKAYDARNDQYYYVRKIKNTGPNGVGDLCWMHSNLRYEGDGNWNSSLGWADDRYSKSASNSTVNPNDNVRPLTLTSGTGAALYTVAQYANPGGATDYTNIDPADGFYGYLYNWCAAMGGQANACQYDAYIQPPATPNLCPAGWRLPIGTVTTGEFTALNNAINSGSTTSIAGWLTNFLAVPAGAFGSLGLYAQGRTIYMWSYSIAYDWAYNAYYTTGAEGVLIPATSGNKSVGMNVRCVR